MTEASEITRAKGRQHVPAIKGSGSRHGQSGTSDRLLLQHMMEIQFSSARPIAIGRGVSAGRESLSSTLQLTEGFLALSHRVTKFDRLWLSLAASSQPLSCPKSTRAGPEGRGHQYMELGRTQRRWKFAHPSTAVDVHGRLAGGSRGDSDLADHHGGR